MAAQTGPARSRSLYRRGGKRALDIVLSSLLLAILWPLLLLIAVAVRWQHGAPILFRQQRPGKDGKPFTLYKFRTMREAFDAEGAPLADEERLTAFGRWLRTTSLDELPELANVVRGEMSLVGPRPLLMKYLARYTPEQRRRHEVRPGITGWAQVNGRNAVSWPQKFTYDVWYVDHLSLRVDLYILWMTVSQVFRRQGINQPGSATATEFLGEADD